MPLSALVQQVDIPYEKFVLANGLTTIVHTDRKAPIVGVTVYYRVGAKHEPRGRTGFAHLFEHIMFTGSENVPNFDAPLEAAGSTSTNGSTDQDRTNYVEVVPTGALDLALFMESDRMGYLLGALDQDKLDKQRGVVQNEKRQGDNQPYGLTFYALQEGLFPVGHPYRHSTIGSMADLEAASLTDVRNWFSGNYGPNNVVLALTGDIDAATARPMIERWFGDIPRGPEVVKVAAGPVTLAAPASRDMTDQVPLEQIYRVWSGPGLMHEDANALAVGLHILGGLSSSRLDNILVREEELAVSVSAGAYQQEDVSLLYIQMDVKPGIDRALAEARLDEVIAQMLAEGPREDELQRAATQVLSTEIGSLERVGGFYGKGMKLAEGELFTGDPAYYKRQLAQIAELEPATVRGALQHWLGRPVYRLAILPGERTESGEEMGGWGDEHLVAPPAPDPKHPLVIEQTGPERSAPPVAPVGELAFPAIEHAQLSNGIPVVLARRTAVPKLMIELDFNAGYSADGAGHEGLQSLMVSMLSEGTTSMDATAIAEASERLGASIAAETFRDTSTVTLTALSGNLLPSLDLMADIARNPAFDPDETARLRDQQLASIAQELASPVSLGQRAIDPLLFGEEHPYGTPGGSGRSETVSALTAEMLHEAHASWLRPDNASITVVGDVTMAELLPALEASFGDWQAPASALPAKDLSRPVPEARQRLAVIDRPSSTQSVLLLGRVLPLSGTDAELEALGLANEVIGNGFLSRLNSNLREEKGWSYGIRSSVARPLGPRTLTVTTRVQADRTGDAIQLILDDMAAFPAASPVSEEELQRVTDGNIRGLPNRFETNAQVLGALSANRLLGRPDDYQAQLPGIYRAIDAAAINDAAANYLQPDDLVIVVVGDRSVIDSQLDELGMTIEYLDASKL